MEVSSVLIRRTSYDWKIRDEQKNHYRETNTKHAMYSCNYSFFFRALVTAADMQNAYLGKHNVAGK